MPPKSGSDAPHAAFAAQKVASGSPMAQALPAGRAALWCPTRPRARLDREPPSGQCLRSGRACGMKLLSHLSPEGKGPPEPADARRAALGFEAWHEALVAEPNSGPAPRWSATSAGEGLLASIFGNSPFLSGVAVREQSFLTRVVEEGADPVFAEAVAAVEIAEDFGEDTTALMRRLRIAKRRVALLAAVAELAGAWTLEQQMEALSRFAEAALGAAVRHLLRQAQRKGIAAPVTADPERDSGLIVLGMGKLGGYDLNYSSDIDLILLYDATRAQVGGRDGIQTFFVRVARDLGRILDERT